MKTINAHETEGVVDANASVHVSELPFATGDRVRILVLGNADPKLWRHTADEIDRSKQIRQGLKGTVIQYDRPDEPVGIEDWEMLNDESEGK
ncbi:MAG: hypothetical protein DMG10_05430 [Acidobacteria bacterium]|nr:MAG: hypothetical protein DMG10_05430 [Acidobacteriota bacterium]